MAGIIRKDLFKIQSFMFWKQRQLNNNCKSHVPTTGVHIFININI